MRFLGGGLQDQSQGQIQGPDPGSDVSDLGSDVSDLGSDVSDLSYISVFLSISQSNGSMNQLTLIIHQISVKPTSGSGWLGTRYTPPSTHPAAPPRVHPSCCTR